MTYLRVPNNVEKGNDVGSPRQVLQNLDLALDLLLLDGLENLDDAFLVIHHVYSFENLGVFSPA
jgi:hypothetical protein